MAKMPECDREAARLLALQLKPNTKARGIYTVLIAAFVTAIAAFSILFWILPDRAKSDTENRTLTQFPRFSIKALTEGSFAVDFAAYMADQFPARDFFIGVKTVSEQLQLRGQNNGVIFAEDGTLITRDEYPSTANLETNLTSVAHFFRYAESLGIPSTLALAGRNADVQDHTLPSYYGSAYSDRLWETAEEMAEQAGVEMLNLRDPLRALAQSGEYVYYRTDHHWTSLGAYYAYREILRAMGGTPYAIDTFTRELAADDFYGTTHSTAGSPSVAPDTIEYFRFDGDESYTTASQSGTVLTAFYDRSYLAVKDKYSSFLGGNTGRVDVRSGEEGRPTLLLIKDSFAHSAAPMLARHYDLIIIDPRYYRLNIAELLTAEAVDGVLVLCNIDSFTASALMRVLGATPEF